MSAELMLASAIFIAIGVILAVVFMLTKFIGPQNKDSVLKNNVYESGVTNPVGTTNNRISVQFYMDAISFLLYDVEVIFLLPWAVNVVDLGVAGLFKMFIFMGLLFIGLIYIYKKKALSWD